jgi:predicted type IV restriction endonuclease
MDFKDQIKQLGERIQKLKTQIETEEATKNAFILPFIQALGYDVFNPLEVLPEFTCDIGTKKGEKIDYAIFKDGQPIILIECKHWAQNLNLHDNQLLRYFNVSKAKFGILTNGVNYRFYTDLVETNKMDEKPFFEIEITSLKENQVEELKKFHKSYFDIDNIVNTASELKFTSELKKLLRAEMENPSENFVRLFAKQVYPTIVTAKVLEQFTHLIKKSFNQVISDSIQERLKSALNKEAESSKVVDQEVVQEVENPEENEKKIETTFEEMEAFYIVKSIVRNVVDISKISHRDTMSYFGILFDDNNRKPICRLYLNGNKKFIGIFDSNKKESKVEIQGVDDIYSLSRELITVAEFYTNIPQK